MSILPIFCKTIPFLPIPNPTTKMFHSTQKIFPHENITVDELNKLLFSLKGPIELDLRGCCYNLGSELIQLPEGVQITKLKIQDAPHITPEQVTELLKNSTGPIELELSKCHLNINRIYLPTGVYITQLDTHESDITAEQITELLKHSRGTICLELCGCRRLGKELIQLPEGVQIKNLNVITSSITAQQLSALLKHSTSPTQLYVCGCSNLGNELIQLPDGFQIERLRITHSSITAEQLTELLKHVTGPIELDLTGCRKLGSELIRLPEGVQITKLNITYSSVTAEQLTELLKHVTGPIELDLKGCHNLGSGLIQLPEGVQITGLNVVDASITPLQWGTLLERVQDVASVLPALASPQDQDVALDHLNNPDYRTFLQLVDALEPQHNAIKLQLVRCILERIEPTLSPSVIPALRDILSANPLYYTDPAIRGFMTRKMLPAAIQSCERTYTVFSEFERGLLLPELVTACGQVRLDGVDFHGQHLSLAHFSALVNQCLYQTESILDRGSLQDAYRKIPCVAGIMSRIEFARGEVDALFVGAKDGIVYGVGVTTDFFHDAVVEFKPDIIWNNCYLYKDGVPQVIETVPGDIFRVVTLFEGNYLFSQNNVHLLKLVTDLGLSPENTACFIEATKKKTSSVKWVDERIQARLRDSLGPLFVGGGEKRC